MEGFRMENCVKKHPGSGLQKLRHATKFYDFVKRAQRASERSELGARSDSNARKASGKHKAQQTTRHRDNIFIFKINNALPVPC